MASLCQSEAWIKPEGKRGNARTLKEYVKKYGDERIDDKGD
jgi:hypothetical protein